MVLTIVKKPLISNRTAFILGFIIIISYILISLYLRNNISARTIFGDIAPIIIEIIVIITLVYATLRSAYYGKRIQMAWMFITLAFTIFAIGDIIWAIYEIGLNLNPFPSIADIFYLIFYPIFAIGIYFLPKFSFNRNEKIKIFIDLGIIIATLIVIYMTFIIIPTISNPTDYFSNIISLIYVIGDLLLFFMVLRLLYSKFEDNYTPILLLGMGILVMIITDTIFSYQTLHNTYMSGGLLDSGWIISYVLVGLAAFMQSSPKKVEFNKFLKLQQKMKDYDITSYLPLIWVLIAFLLLIWAIDNYHTYIMFTEMAVGFIIILVIIRQIITLRENKSYFNAAQTEIAERKLAEEKALENEIYYRAIFQNTGTAMILIEENMIISKVNSEVETLTGFTSKEIEGKKKWTDFVVEDELDRLNQFFSLIDQPDKHPREYETRGMDKLGNIKDLLVTVALIPNTKKLLISIIDITKRKLAENEIKSSLKQKSTLVQEVHHRVKNNMQIISSLLNLQTKYVDDEEALNVLKESQNRVMSMAMIHEKLYMSDDLANINFKDYIRSLISNLFYSYNVDKTYIKSVTDIADISLNMETAVPCGLIISELVSNTLKYAFTKEMDGEVFVSLTADAYEYELIVKDNGIGLPEDLDFDNLESLGLLLVKNLTEQIDGKITINRYNGTEFKITFKESSYSNRMD
jgi:two-component system, sensor histidine kinase PdtaS